MNPSLIKLDIACGSRKREGFVGIDAASIPGVDIVHDLEIFPWPIESESVEEAHVAHYVEHTRDLIAFMNELYRVMRPGAVCTVIAPYYTSIRAWRDPTHTRAISEETFLYFDATWRRQRGLDHYPIRCDFACTFGLGLYPEWTKKNPDELKFAVRHYWNVVTDIHAKLVKR